MSISNPQNAHMPPHNLYRNSIQIRTIIPLSRPDRIRPPEIPQTPKQRPEPEVKRDPDAQSQKQGHSRRQGKTEGGDT
jgi:hypothetical protein